MKRLYILSGIPGLGKSTWAKNKIEQPNTVWISRDAIRFSIINNEEEYFSHENEVLIKFYDEIQKQINDMDITDIIVDATHLTQKTRQSTLNSLNLSKVDEIICVVFDTPLDVAIKRNEQRTARALVPREVIQRMDIKKTFPTKQEGFARIIQVSVEGEEREATL